MVLGILPFVALALVEILVGPRGAHPPSSGREHSRRQGLQLEHGPELDRHDVDLSPVPGDRGPHAVCHLSRGDLARDRMRLETGDRPHPRLAHKRRTDHGNSNAGSSQLLAKSYAKYEYVVLGRCV